VPVVTHFQIFPLNPKYSRYEIQRSGPIPEQRLAWRSDSCKVCHADNGADLSGAWYEAANTMKWGLRKYKKKFFTEEREKVIAGLRLC
jgi:Glycosyl hydrolase family 9